jgi:hypothetical protein
MNATNGIIEIDTDDEIESLMHHTLERLGVTLIQLSHCDLQNNYETRWTIADLKAAKQVLDIIAGARQFLDDGKCAAALSTIWCAGRMMLPAPRL